MIRAAGPCPYIPLCEREVLGPDLEPQEQARLDQHLSQGCDECEACIETNLSGEGPAADPGADARRHLDDVLSRAVAEADDALAQGQLTVLARVQDRIRREQARAQQVVRRRHLRAVFYLTNVAAVFLLLVAYVGTWTAARVQRRAAQLLAARTEVQALAGALRAWAHDHEDRLPEDPSAFVEALAAQRAGRTSPYYAFSRERLREGVYYDAFDRPYRYRPADGRALLYSTGPDGEDDGGADDDLSAWVVPPPR